MTREGNCRCRRVTVLVLLAGWGCGDASDAMTTWTAAVDTVGDTVVVRTMSGSVWRDTATLVPEVRVGVLEGADEYMLGEVAGVAVAPTGELYIMDRYVPALRKYGAEGEYLATFGREGGGPGEYQRPDGGVAVLSDGRVVLRDPGNGQLIVYSPEGEYLDGWRLPGGFSSTERLYTDSADNTYSLILLESGLPPWEWTYGLARYTATGEHTDTVIAPTWDYDRPVVTGSREGSSSLTSIPFTGHSSWTFSPRGYAVGGLGTEYRIDLYQPHRVVRLEKAWTPVPVLPEEAEERERRIRKRYQRQYPGWRWNGPSIPGFKAAFNDVFVGEDGRIWVEVPGTAYEAVSRAAAREAEERSGRPQIRYREPSLFDVFEPDGTFLGHVEAPREFRTDPAPIFLHDQIWAVAQDEFDVMYVVRYRIESGSTGSGSRAGTSDEDAG